MNDSPDEQIEQQELWRQYRRGDAPTSSPAPPPDASVLAAYLDGQAEADQVEAVEACMADNPEFLQTVIALRNQAQAGDRGEPAPDAVLHKARALLEADAVAGRIGSWSRRWSWAAAAAVLVTVCLMGYGAGRATAGGQQDLTGAVVQDPLGLDDNGDDIPIFATLGAVDGGEEVVQ